MILHEEMAWKNVRSMDLVKIPKINSSYDLNKAWVTMYDDQPVIFRPSVAGFTDLTTRFPRSPIPAFSDHCDNAVEDGSVADNSPVQACKKITLTPKQTKTLETSFETDNKLEGERKQQLAKDLGMQPRQVAVWFQNRRARWKTKRLEQDYATLKFKFDAVVEENEELKAEIEKLTEELHSRNPFKSKLAVEVNPSEPHRIKVEARQELSSAPASFTLEQLPSSAPESVILDAKPTKADSSRDQTAMSTANSETNYSDVMDEESPRGGEGSFTRATMKLEDDRQSNAGTDMTEVEMNFCNEGGDDHAIVLKLEEIGTYQFSYETTEPYVDMFGAASEHHLWYFNSP